MGKESDDDKSKHSDSSSDDKSDNHYKIDTPGPGAYGQMLHDLARAGIHASDIEKIKEELDKNDIELTTTQIAVLLRDPMGSQAGLRQFETTLTTEERQKFDKAMPQIKIILAAAAASKSKAQSRPPQGSSGAAYRSSNYTITSTITNTSTTASGPATPGAPGSPSTVPTGGTLVGTTSTANGAKAGAGVVPHTSGALRVLGLDGRIVQFAAAAVVAVSVAFL